jgi:hypothetical protein
VLKSKKNITAFRRRIIRFIDIPSGLFFKANELGCYKAIFSRRGAKKKAQGA